GWRAQLDLVATSQQEPGSDDEEPVVLYVSPGREPGDVVHARGVRADRPLAARNAACGSRGRGRGDPDGELRQPARRPGRLGPRRSDFRVVRLLVRGEDGEELAALGSAC